jgi:hypothetical protein
MERNTSGPMWKDWRWWYDKPFICYNTKKTYEKVRPTFQTEKRLIRRWALQEVEYRCFRRIQSIWKTRVDFKFCASFVGL